MTDSLADPGRLVDSGRLASRRVASGRLALTGRLAASWRVGFGQPWLADPRLGALMAVVLWLAVVAMAAPIGRSFGTGQEAIAYWSAPLADPYATSEWTLPGGYVYSPAFLQLVSPLTRLPWLAFMAVWAAILLVTLRLLTGHRWFVLGVLAAAMEIAGGNISLLLGVAIVAGFRWPAAWAFVLLTKITPGIGLLWFALRREWRSLAMALGATALIVLVSMILMPTAWPEWIEVLRRATRHDGTPAAVPVPFLVRLPFALALLVWGARTDRRWTVPVASMLALPALWFGSLTMLLAVIPLLKADGDRSARAAGPATRAGDGRGT
ncbi:MAG: glycosyltransferase family 87 protein [Candidatus Limnocylindrales bacterium]